MYRLQFMRFWYICEYCCGLNLRGHCPEPKDANDESSQKLNNSHIRDTYRNSRESCGMQRTKYSHNNHNKFYVYKETVFHGTRKHRTTTNITSVCTFLDKINIALM